MFNEDFYPTPSSIIERMLSSTTIVGKVILEPSAGKGDIVDHLKGMGAKEVLACETEKSLLSILGGKCRVVENDFLQLTADKISHIDMIIMNPPFSKMEDHINHAWSIAPAGCEIISLCNESLIKNSYSKQRTELLNIIKMNGSFEHYGSCFDTAERRTNIGISCVRMHKANASSNEFDGFFDLTPDEEEKCEVAGLMSYNYVRDVVGRYIDAVNMFEQVVDVNHRMSQLISPIDGTMNIRFGAFNVDRQGHINHTDRDTFKKELQKSAWKSIFSKFDMGKYVTKGVMSDINKYVEQQIHVPFTMKNIYKMIEMIVGTHESRMGKILVEAFEKICSFSSENSTGGEGWKTNSDYVINKRFIKPYVCKYDPKWPSNKVDVGYDADDYFDDIVKALCQLTGINYEDYIPLRTFFGYPYKLRRKDGGFMGGYSNCFQESHGYYNTASARKAELLKQGIEVEIEKTGQEWGVWHEWGFFRVRGYKKGTMHFEFIDDNVLEMFNRKVAEIKGWRLPKSTKKAYRAKTEGVVVY